MAVAIQQLSRLTLTLLLMLVSASGERLTQRSQMRVPDGAGRDLFASSIAISGDTIVAGRPEAHDGGFFAGAADVFVRAANGWMHQATLIASNSHSFADFGQSVAIDGDTIVIGAGSENSESTGINGDSVNERPVESAGLHQGLQY